MWAYLGASLPRRWTCKPRLSLRHSAYNSAWAMCTVYHGNAQERDQARKAVDSLSSTWKFVSLFSLSRWTKHKWLEKQRWQLKFLNPSNYLHSSHSLLGVKTLWFRRQHLPHQCFPAHITLRASETPIHIVFRFPWVTYVSPVPLKTLLW